MSETRRIFGLNDLIDLELYDEWVNLQEVWIDRSPSLPEIKFIDGEEETYNNAYFGGGFDSDIGAFGNETNIVDRIEYSTDTTVRIPGANLNEARYRIAATGNSAAGYFAGGSPGNKLTVERLNYKNETTSLLPGSPLSVSRRFLAATGNKTTGYFGGGTTGFTEGGGGSNYSTMDKLSYADDTISTLPASGSLSAVRYGHAATGNSTAGYFGGGRLPNPAPNGLTTMDKLSYSDDTRSTLPASGSLSAGRYRLAATGNQTAGYFGGGDNGPSNVTTMDKISYSDDTRSTLPASGSLSSSRNSLAATGNSTAGYFGGGGTTTTMDKISYASDTTAAVPGAGLSQTRRDMGAVSSLFAGDSLRNPPDPTPTSQTSLGPGPSPNTGYFGGGDANNTIVSTMDKLSYALDTIAVVPGANLSAAKHSLAATGNATHGYFGGGPGPVTTMDKVTYASDTTAAVPGAALSVARQTLAATGNLTAGYFGGGSPGSKTTMDKISYSDDTRSTLPASGSLSVARNQLAATGNSTAGYFGGGNPGPLSTMDKLSYSNDTRSTLPASGSLSGSRRRLAATGNSTHGYFGGGQDSDGDAVSTMDKLSYASDTRSTLPASGSLSGSRQQLAATGNLTAGYFGGGSPSDKSTMDKISYASDTRSTLPASGSLSSERHSVAASSARANGAPSSPTNMPLNNIV